MGQWSDKHQRERDRQEGFNFFFPTFLVNFTSVAMASHRLRRVLSDI